MFRGLYSGASVLDNLSRQHQITASNLAHLNSAGHRRALFSVAERSVADVPGSNMPGPALSPGIDFKTSGRLEMTQRPLDLSIQGEGFFKFQGEQESIYSRNGVLFRNPEGQLQNADGLPLLGENGPLVVPPDIPDAQIAIGSDGTINVAGDSIGKVEIVKFNDNRLLASDSQISFKIGNAVAVEADESSIVQGSRELSNAQPVTELINLIISSRHFENAQRAIKTISETIQQSVRE